MGIKMVKEKANNFRKQILDLVYKAQSSHIGSNFSVIDILAVLDDVMTEDDKLIFSKGWVAAAAYTFWAHRGKLDYKEVLEKYCADNSPFIGLVEPLPGGFIEFAGGSMGFGLPAGVGFALAKKLKKEPGRVFVLMSDGEMDIGTTWEAALIAAHHNLNNLIVIVDSNKFQATGRTNEILKIEPLKEKWQSFGWKVLEIDGHNFEEVKSALSCNFSDSIAPVCFIAHTTKGKGCKRFEDKLEWHYRNVDKDTYEECVKELCESCQRDLKDSRWEISLDENLKKDTNLI